MNEEKLKLLASMKLSLQLACMQYDSLEASLDEQEKLVFKQNYSKLCCDVSADQEKN